MRYDVDKDSLVFNTGKELDAVVGMGMEVQSGAIRIYAGYDYVMSDKDFTPEEGVELADYMIDQWKKWKLKYEGSERSKNTAS